MGGSARGILYIVQTAEAPSYITFSGVLSLAYIALTLQGCGKKKEEGESETGLAGNMAIPGYPMAVDCEARKVKCAPEQKGDTAECWMDFFACRKCANQGQSPL